MREDASTDEIDELVRRKAHWKRLAERVRNVGGATELLKLVPAEASTEIGTEATALEQADKDSRQAERELRNVKGTLESISQKIADRDYEIWEAQHPGCIEGFFRLFDSGASDSRLSRLQAAKNDLVDQQKREADTAKEEAARHASAEAAVRRALKVVRNALNGFANTLEKAVDTELASACARYQKQIRDGFPPYSWGYWDAAAFDGIDFQEFAAPGPLAFGFQQRIVEGHELRTPFLIDLLGEGMSLGILGPGGLGLMHSLILQLACMFPHGVQFTLLDPRGMGRAFPMRAGLTRVRGAGASERDTLEQVSADAARIIRTYIQGPVERYMDLDEQTQADERLEVVCLADYPEAYDDACQRLIGDLLRNGPTAGKYVLFCCSDASAAVLDLDSVLRFDTSQSSDAVLCLEVPEEVSNAIYGRLRSAPAPRAARSWEATGGGRWQGDSTSAIHAAIGTAGGGRQLEIWFGERNGQPCASGVLAGMSGSGKSNLYHVVIAELVSRYSPEELELYLIDGKHGSTFQYYTELPHARVVALHSIPELTRNVMRHLVDEVRRRNELFHEVGVDAFDKFRRKGRKLPRVLLLIDEYQEIFERDNDGVAADSLRQLTRQGRSAGVHLLIGAHQFGAAGMLYRDEIFLNIHLRMAMQQDPAALLNMVELGRSGAALVQQCDAPGKIVINPSGGNDDANVLGRVYFLAEEARERVVAASAREVRGRPVVIQGVAPPSLADNMQLRLLASAAKSGQSALRGLAKRDVSEGGLGIPDWSEADRPTVLWLGQELELYRYCTPILRRANDNNLLVISPDHAARFGLLAAVVVSLVVNTMETPSSVRVANFGHAGSEWTQSVIDACAVARAVGTDCTDTTESAGLEQVLLKLDGELERRRALPDAKVTALPATWLLVTDAHRARCLQSRSDDYEGTEATKRLRRLVDAGPQNGIHVVLSFDTLHGFRRILNDQDLGFFLHRVVTRIPDQESFTLVEDRLAAQLPVGADEPTLAVYRAHDVGINRVFKPHVVQSGPTGALLTQIFAGRGHA